MPEGRRRISVNGAEGTGEWMDNPPPLGGVSTPGRPLDQGEDGKGEGSVVHQQPEGWLWSGPSFRKQSPGV